MLFYANQRQTKEEKKHFYKNTERLKTHRDDSDTSHSVTVFHQTGNFKKKEKKSTVQLCRASTYITWIFCSVFARSQFHKCVALVFPRSLACSTSFTMTAAVSQRKWLLSCRRPYLSWQLTGSGGSWSANVLFFKNWSARNVASCYRSCCQLFLRIVRDTISRDKEPKLQALEFPAISWSRKN